QRSYVLNDESGLLLCSWPHGGRPRFPFVYSDEVWTGIEYQVAAHLIYEGWLDEGLEIVEAVRARHDGIRRNPWNEVECGHHYARSMSSWALLLAISGFHCDVARGRLAFAPVLGGAFRCFFSTGTAWGTFEQRPDGDGLETRLSVEHGRLELRQLELQTGAAMRTGVATLRDRPLALRLEPSAGGTTIEFGEAAVVGSGESLSIRLAAG
ncbi:MAG TPA: GH116 family glycosyl hydrolase, partial [Ardenticatenaceae bacterium]|nr:GH116 family glycosyl hydrolase [Ardenticatenaceae bacterium]